MQHSGRRATGRAAVAAAFALAVLLLLGLASAESPKAAVALPGSGAAPQLQQPHHQPSFGWTYAPAAPSLYRAYDTAPRLHFAVVCVPLWDHFTAVHAIAEELTHRGHHVTYFVESPDWCEAVLGAGKGRAAAALWDVDCVIVHATVGGKPERFSATFFAKVSEQATFPGGFNDLGPALFAHHAETLPVYLDAVGAVHWQEPFTTFLCDTATFACSSVARSLDVAVVHVSPLTLHMALGFHSELPTLGTALPRSMTTWQRTKNYATKLTGYASTGLVVSKLNRARRQFGVPLYVDGFDVSGLYDTVIVQGLWGLDIAQPLCPNIHPVGALLPRAERRAAAPRALLAGEPELVSFLDRCKEGVLYVDFGAHAHAAPPMARKLLQAFKNVPFCVVWKMPDAEQAALATELSSDAPSLQLFIRPRLAFPAAIMRHPSVFALVSHCSDAAAMEAIDASLPVIGLPMFADQGDVCRRIGEAEAGVCLSGKYSFSPREVEDAIWSIVRDNGQYAANLRRLQAVSKSLGGATRAADIIESRQYNLLLRRGSAMETCTALAGGVWRATGLWHRLLLLLLSCLVWWAALDVAGRGWQRLSDPIRYVVGAAAAWRHRRAKPQRSQLRIVPRRYWGAGAKDD